MTFPKKTKRESEKPMDDLMDGTNWKANMVLSHAVYVWPEAPAHCLSEKDLHLDTLRLTGTWEGLHVYVLLSQGCLALLG